MNIQSNISLKNFNTFGIDVKAKLFAEYSSLNELIEIIQMDEFQNNRILHIGSGSNLLFTKNFEGVILHSKIIETKISYENDDEVILRVGAGLLWDELVDYAVRNNYYGIENLSLIPGEVGAAAVQNIGAYGVEIKDFIHSVEYFDLESASSKTMSNEGCKYAYRNSIFKNELKGKAIITHVNIRLHKREQYCLDYVHLQETVMQRGEINLENIRNTIIEIRQSKLPDPAILGNAGSFYMNPIVEKSKFEKILADYPQMPYYKIDGEQYKIPAAWLIEKCGLKGKRFGKVGIYEKQALVLVNYGGATGQDIAELSSHIQEKVVSQFGIKLTPEVNFIT